MNTSLSSLALIVAATLLTSCASSGGGTSTLAGVKPYPLKVCLITDNDLNSMGDQQTHTYQGQQLKFCCAPCWDKFQTAPATYLAKLK